MTELSHRPIFSLSHARSGDTFTSHFLVFDHTPYAKRCLPPSYTGLYLCSHDFTYPLLHSNPFPFDSQQLRSPSCIISHVVDGTSILPVIHTPSFNVGSLVLHNSDMCCAVSHSMSGKSLYRLYMPSAPEASLTTAPTMERQTGLCLCTSTSSDSRTNKLPCFACFTNKQVTAFASQTSK
jgi:hypothetical protein